MASITKRRSKFAVVYWYLDEKDTRKQKWETCETKKEAKARKAFIEFYQQTNGLVIVPLTEQFAKEREKAQEELENPNSDITLREFLEIFVNIYGVSTWSANTFSSKQSSINNYINPIIGDWKLSDITTKKISKYYNDLLSVPEVPRANRKATGRCVQPTNIKKIHDIIRCALNQAILWEYLDTKMRNPASLAILPKIQKVRRDVWDIETFKQAISIVDDDLLLLSMQLAFSCSLRIGEITGLTWKDIIIDDESIENGTARVIVTKELSRVSLNAMQKLKEKDIIKIFPTQKPHATTRLVLKTPKTESSKRTVWLPKTVATLLRRYKHDQDELKEFLGSAYNDHELVIALDNGNPVEGRIIRDRFQDLCMQNNFEVVVFHSLRHLSTGYKLKMTNGDIKSVQGDTGHAEAEMVMDVYSRVIDEDRRLNAKKLEEQFYGTLDESKQEVIKEVSSSENDVFFANLIDFMADENNRKRLQAMLTPANT
ncbi:tyrosine-type recombinase/integrase family protein [Listeria monocytogenes]